MLKYLIKRQGYILISLFLFSPNLYAFCLDHVGLKQRAGYEVLSDSENEDITDTGTNVNSGQIISVNYNSESSSSLAGIAYYLEYCDLSGFVLNFNAAIITGSGEFTNSGAEINRFTREYETSGIGTGLFIGYEW